jgi:hypothetical protein
MPIWLILGIGAGVVVGGWALSKLIPWIIRSIQYSNHISKEQYDKNLEMINEKSKQRAIKKEAKKRKKEEKKLKRQARNAKIKKAIIKKSKNGLVLVRDYAKFAGDTMLRTSITVTAVSVATAGFIAHTIIEKKQSHDLANSLKSKSDLNKEPLKLASPNPEYDLSVIEAKIDEITALQQKQKLTNEEAKQLKKLQKETSLFFRHNKGYEMALINKKVQGKINNNKHQPLPPPTPQNDKTRQL